MIRTTIATAIALVCLISIARAQALEPEAKIGVYRQLLTQANDNIVALGAQLQAVQRENAKLKEQIAKEAPPAKSP